MASSVCLERIIMLSLLWASMFLRVSSIASDKWMASKSPSDCNTSTEAVTDEDTIRLMNSCSLPAVKLTEIVKMRLLKAEERLEVIRATLIRPAKNRTMSPEQDQLYRKARSKLALGLAESLAAVGFEAATKLKKQEIIDAESGNIVMDARNQKLPFTFPPFEMESRDRLTIREEDGHHGDSHPALGILYESLHKEITHHILLDEESQSGPQPLKYVINSHVIAGRTSCPIGNVTITLSHLNETNGNDTICAFWNSTTVSASNSSNGFWSTNGCMKDTGRSNSSQTVCVCTHLTNFAILMSIGNFQVPTQHAFVLKTITQVGSIISIASLLIGISLLLLLLCGEVHHSRHIIHLNFMTALVLGQIAFVTGIEATENKSLCISVAVLLHYFFLASFAWMLVEGIYLYLHVIKVFAHKSWRIWHYLLFAWGGAGVIVSATSALAPTSYNNSDYCWFSRSGLTLWTFVGPVLFIALINQGILVLVIFEIVKISNKGGMEAAWVATRSSVLLLPLLGSTWIFGILTLNYETLVFHYIFTVCNTLQGCLVSLFYCFLNTEVRVGVRRRMQCIIASSWTLGLLRSLWSYVTKNAKEDSRNNIYYLKPGEPAKTGVSSQKFYIRKSSLLHPV